MNRLTKLTFQYYRLLLTYNIAFTLLVVVMAFPASVSNVAVIFITKIIGFLSAAGLHYFLADKTLFYFRNAGVSARRVIISAFLMETFCCIILLILFKLAFNAIIYIKD